MSKSHLERQFDLVWLALRGPKLDAESRFHPLRQWRFDRIYQPAMVAIEIEGGIFSRKPGRHNRGTGFRDDCIKYNSATRLGWMIYRLCEGMINAEHIGPIVDHCRAVDIICGLHPANRESLKP